MGPLRAGVIIAAPRATPACDATRPDWDGTAVTAMDEALFLAATPAVLVLILASALAIRFRHQWGALAVVLGWTGVVSLIAMGDPTGQRVAQAAEGCLGSPSLFIAVVAAICVGMILYTTPRAADADAGRS